MQSVFYHPHVGKNYETEGFMGVKLLILGESHYCSERKKCEVCGIGSNRHDCNNFTIKVIDEGFLAYKKGQGEFERWMNTFTRFTNVVLDNQADAETLVDFWDSVIFYNYVQSSTVGPRISPTSQQFVESEEAFFEVLEKYKPDLIIVWGNRLWDNLGNGRWAEENILDDVNHRFYYYKISSKEIPAFHVYHPSTKQFNYYSTKLIKEAIRLVGGNNE